MSKIIKQKFSECGIQKEYNIALSLTHQEIDELRDGHSVTWIFPAFSEDDKQAHRVEVVLEGKEEEFDIGDAIFVDKAFNAV